MVLQICVKSDLCAPPEDDGVNVFVGLIGSRAHIFVWSLRFYQISRRAQSSIK